MTVGIIHESWVQKVSTVVNLCRTLNRALCMHNAFCVSPAMAKRFTWGCLLCAAQKSLKTERQAKKDRAFPQRKFAVKA